MNWTEAVILIIIKTMISHIKSVSAHICSAFTGISCASCEQPERSDKTIILPLIKLRFFSSVLHDHCHSSPHAASSSWLIKPVYDSSTEHWPVIVVSWSGNRDRRNMFAYYKLLRGEKNQLLGRTLAFLMSGCLKTACFNTAPWKVLDVSVQQ